RGEPGQPVRVHSVRKVQHRIGRVQVRHAGAAVGDPDHRDLAEHRGQGAVPAPLDPGALAAFGVHDLLTTRLVPGPQGQVVLEQLPGDLAHPRSQQILQLRVRHHRRLGGRQLRGDRGEQPSRGGEGVLALRERTPGRPHRAHHPCFLPSTLNSPDEGSARIPRSTSLFSFERIPSTCRGSVPRPRCSHTSLQRIAAPEVANKAMISRYSGDITVTSSSASAFTSAAATPPPASPPAVSASGTGEDGAASTSSTVSRAICNRDSRSSARDNSSDRPAICSRSRSAWPSTSARLDSNASIKDGTPHPPSLSTRTPHGGLDPSDGKSRHNRPHPEPLRITPTRHPQKIYTQLALKIA